MPTRTNDQLVEQARQRMREQIEAASKRAATKIAAKWKSGKPSVASLAEMIAKEFAELNP